jgi:hypothetical protein
MYEEDELEQYADYMEYIREAIAEESVKKFTMNNFKPTPDDIEITHVSRNNGFSNEELKDKWTFYYTIKAPSIHPTLYIPDTRIDKTQGMSRKVSFNEWKRMKVVNARIEKLNLLGI